jgi:hypothetical protein
MILRLDIPSLVSSNGMNGAFWGDKQEVEMCPNLREDKVAYFEGFLGRGRLNKYLLTHDYSR